MAKALKELYNERYLTLLSNTISQYYPSFDSLTFKKKIFNSQWQNLELKERMRHISITLDNFLSDEYKKNIDILIATFNDINYAFGLENIIFQDYVEVYGLNDFDISMRALQTFTIQSSSEFAIRQFLLKYPNKTLQEMKQWASSKNEHLRRLASEGCRPRLPWAVALPQFKDNPFLVLEILELLKDDESPYVRKSVANNLNDISKENPQIVKKLAKRWFGVSKERDAILKHGCRTLLKSGDKEVLELFGFIRVKNLLIQNFSSHATVQMGKELHFSFELFHPKELGLLRVEFALDFLRKNNKYNRKVFQLSQAHYKSKYKSFQKSYSFKKISTRVYYPGIQKLSIIVNGVTIKEFEFSLLEASAILPLV